MSGTASKPPQPPVNDPPITSDNQHSQAWTAFFQDLSGLLGQIMGTGVIMQTGTSTSDAAGDFSVTLPRQFTLRTLSFDVDGNPGGPGPLFVATGLATPLPLDIITGGIGTDTGGGTITPVVNTDFTWFATGI